MAHEIVMPRLGWSTEEGILIEWLKQDGDVVRAGEVVCVIESDKAQMEVEAFETGVLRIPAASPALGARVPVGTLLGYILGPGETLPASTARTAPPPPAPAMTIDTDRGGRITPSVAPPATTATVRAGTPAASPRARRV